MIRKSTSDHRLYQSITLANSLNVLLIEDEKSHKSAASMVVNAGHFDDPADCNGLAHFIEHMLFLGTETYPDAEDYQQFVSQHAGHHNAWTASEHTNFFFDIQAEAFEPALTRFSQFFICPLFSQEYIDKERQAIESEFQLKRKDDLRRLYQVHKETVNPAHPFSRFSVGNLTTLVETPDISLKQRLHKFFDDNYLANRMRLVLAGPQSLKELKRLAHQLFNGIRHNGIVKEKITSPIYLPAQQACKIEMQTLREANQIILSFALDAVQDRYKDKSITYLGYMLGREEEGSLLNYLRINNWANSLSAGGGVDASNFKDFNLTIQLTEDGKQHINDICYATFAYINFLKQRGIQDFIYTEKQQLSQLAFRYQETVKLLDWTSALALKMHHYPCEDLIIADYLMEGLDIDWIEQAYKKFSPSNLRLIQLNHLPLTNAQQCQWYDAPYTIAPLSDVQITRWQTASLDDAFLLPVPNPYIPTRQLPLLQSETHKITTPRKLIDSDALVLWFKQDERFDSPKSHIYLSLDLPNSQGCVKKTMLTHLFIELFLDNIERDFYHAETAGMHYHMYPHQAGLTIHISGFSDKQVALLSDILTELKQLNFNPSRFDEIKHQILQSLRNANKGKPISHLFSCLNSMLQSFQYGSHQLADALLSIDVNDLFQHLSTLFEHLHVESLVYGDADLHTAKDVETIIKDILISDTPTGKTLPRKVYKLTSNKQISQHIESEHPDDCIIVYYQAKTTSERQAALYTLTNHILSPAFFNQLRTEKQLGYMLGTGYMPVNQQPGWIAYVQSNKANTATLLKEIDLFLSEAPEQLQMIDDDSWRAIKHGLIQQLIEKETSLRVSAQKYWLAIGLKDETFSRKQRLAQEIEQLSLAELIAFIEQELVLHHDTTRLILTSSTEPNFDDDSNNIYPVIVDVFQQTAEFTSF